MGSFIGFHIYIKICVIISDQYVAFFEYLEPVGNFDMKVSNSSKRVSASFKFSAPATCNKFKGDWYSQ